MSHCWCKKEVQTRIWEYHDTCFHYFLERSFQLLITPDMLMLAVTMAYTGIVLNASSAWGKLVFLYTFVKD